MRRRYRFGENVSSQCIVYDRRYDVAFLANGKLARFDNITSDADQNSPTRIPKIRVNLISWISPVRETVSANYLVICRVYNRLIMFIIIDDKAL